MIKKFSFRFIAMSLFAFLSFMIVCIVLYANANFNKNFTKDISNIQFEILSSDFSRDLANIEEIRKNSINIFSSLFANKDMKTIFDDKKDTLKMFADFLDKNSKIYAIYIGTKDDKFFNMRRANKHEIGIIEHRADKNDKWFTREIKNGIETRNYYDKNLRVTFSKKVKAIFRASKRKWFKRAVNFPKNVVRTEPYEFDLFQTIGVTYAKEYKDGYVFSLDILTKNISQILQSRTVLKTQNACLVDKDFGIIAKTDLVNLDVTKEIFRLFKDGQKKGTKEIDEQRYIYMVEPYGDDFLIIYANLDTLMMPYEKEFEKNLLLAISLIFVICLGIYFLASLIIKPIILLSKENEKIESRDFDNVKHIRSNIKEFWDLSNSLVSMAKSIQKQQIELEKISETDSLTKIYNRSKLDVCLRVKMDDFNRYGYEFGFIMVDIDHFKRVNDEHGHQVGDKILIEFVNVLKNSIRQNDIIGRWGGEEFAIICKKINIINLEKLAQKLRVDVQNHIFEVIGHKTASFGVSICHEGDSVERLVKRADEALYRAKNSGRNRVEVG